MKKPSVKECLDEIRRLRAENERLTRLVQTQRPELKQLREVEVGLRYYLLNGAETLKKLHADVHKMLGTNNDDLPGFMEMAGILSLGAERVEQALREPQTLDAVDPPVESEGTPSTRV